MRWSRVVDTQAITPNPCISYFLRAFVLRDDPGIRRVQYRAEGQDSPGHYSQVPGARDNVLGVQLVTSIQPLSKAWR